MLNNTCSLTHILIHNVINSSMPHNAKFISKQVTWLPAPLRRATINPFWKCVRALRRENTGIAPLKQGSVLHSDEPAKPHILNKHFGSVFAPPDDEDIPVLPGPSFPNIRKLIINVWGVSKLPLNVKPNKATGPDNIPCRLPKEAAHEISPVLTDIFISSLQSGSLPKDWKLACVFKKGKTNEPANYCPISLTSVCSKLLEHILCHHIREHLDNLSILSVFQHGFRSGHYCFSQLFVTIHDFMTAVDRGIQTHVAVLDFSKAFDLVPHRRLLGKLKHYSITGPTLPVTSGVQQGTLLLFLLYTNDLPVSPQVFDYLQMIVCYITSVDDQLELLNDLTRLEEWALTWGMKFNLSKCTILSVSRSSTHQVLFLMWGHLKSG